MERRCAEWDPTTESLTLSRDLTMHVWADDAERDRAVLVEWFSYHQDRRPFTCPICAVVFKNKYDLRNHLLGTPGHEAVCGPLRGSRAPKRQIIAARPFTSTGFNIVSESVGDDDDDDVRMIGFHVASPLEIIVKPQAVPPAAAAAAGDADKEADASPASISSQEVVDRAAGDGGGGRETVPRRKRTLSAKKAEALAEAGEARTRRSVESDQRTATTTTTMSSNAKQMPGTFWQRKSQNPAADRQRIMQWLQENKGSGGDLSCPACHRDFKDSQMRRRHLLGNAIRKAICGPLMGRFRDNSLAPVNAK